MWAHFWHLLCRSFVYTPSIISQNWWGVALAILVYFGKDWNEIKDGGWRSWTRPSKLRKDLYWAIGAYGALLLCAAVHTVYQDHQDLVGSIRSQRSTVIDLNHRLNALTQPIVTGDITSTAFAPTALHNSKTLMTASAFIGDQGAPTVLYGWAAGLKLSNGSFIEGRILPPLPPNGYIRLGIGPHIHGKQESYITLYETDHLIMNTSNKPIPQGGATYGWIQVLFDVPVSDIDKATFMLGFRDISGTGHKYQKVIGSGFSVKPLQWGVGELKQDSDIQRAKH